MRVPAVTFDGGRTGASLHLDLRWGGRLCPALLFFGRSQFGREAVIP